MRPLLEWLIDLDHVRLGEGAPLSLHWDLPVPPWALLALVLLLLAAALAVYWRERTSLARRISLLVARSMLIAVVLIALCRPSLVMQRNRVEPAEVALVVDRSLTMSLKDTHAPQSLETIANALGLSPPDVQSSSRLGIAIAALLKDDHSPLRTLLKKNALQLFSFAGRAEPLVAISRGASADIASRALAAITADGNATNLAPALELVLDQMPSRRLAAIILASDGQLTGGAGRLEQVLSRAADKQIPIYPMRLGSPLPEIDVEVSSAKAQRVVFANDLLLVEATVAWMGVSQEASCTVQLWDEQSGELADERQIHLEPPGGSRTIELSAKPTREGLWRYRVQAVPLAEERETANNAEIIETQALAEKLRILYVEDHPRFEYRFLKNALLREKSIELSVLLLEADENFVQEGAEPIRRFPQTPEELSRYHVVLMGDVNPLEAWITPAQMQMVVDFVGQQGGGFGLIAGQRHAPQRMLGTPLEKLVPVIIDSQADARQDTPITSGVRVAATDEGLQSRPLRFFARETENEEAIRALPEIFWVAQTLGAKPGANVLLYHPDSMAGAGPLPILVQGRYGAGKLFFQATDDTWRWREHTGELLYDGYWVRAVRELMNTNVAASQRRYLIATDRKSYPFGTAIRVQVEILDPRLVAQDQSTIDLQVASVGQGAPQYPGSSHPVAPLQAERLAPQSNIFEVSFLPPGPGTFTVTARSLLAGGMSPVAKFNVENPDLEMRRRQADHGVLERIAWVTGGKILELENMPAQLEEIHDRSVQIPDDISEPLWDAPLVFLVFLLMISIEWIARKAVGLL